MAVALPPKTAATSQTFGATTTKSTDNPVHQSCTSSAWGMSTQQNTQHSESYVQNMHIKPQLYARQFPRRYAQPYTQPHELTTNASGARIAPYPRMQSSPLHQPVLVPKQDMGKPLLEYHPGVTRLFRRRENVWVHQSNRPVALDTWGEFSDTNQPHEYWTWEEYDPFNPLV